MDTGYLIYLADARERLLDALACGPNVERKQSLVQQIALATRLLESCCTDTEARHTLRQVGHGGGDLSWAAMQLRRELGDLRSGSPAGRGANSRG